MSEKKIVRVVVPENRSPETIKHVFAVASYKGGVERVCRLSGTVEEKLAQYKEFFGKDWNGHGEQVFTNTIESTNKFVPIFGEYEVTSMLHPSTIKAKEAIVALVAEADETLAWNEEMKATWPERKAAIAEKELRMTRKELVEVLGEQGDENSYL